MNELDKLIKACGQGFRSLSLHTDGRWLVKSGRRATPSNRLFTGATPEAAVRKLLKAMHGKVFNGFCEVCGTEEALPGEKYGKKCDERAY